MRFIDGRNSVKQQQQLSVSDTTEFITYLELLTI